MECHIKMPALGEDIQLGMLYDYKTATFFSGVSPWRSSVANPTVDTPPNIVQNAEYKLFTSLDDARKYADLSAEGSLSLDLGVLQATGSAAYLSKKKSTAYEARVYVSCTIVRRTRRIPQETLINIEFPNQLDNKDITHFVAEVVEGATATLTFVQSCDSRDEVEHVRGSLEATLKRASLISGGVEMQLENTNAIKKERLSISYSGALAVQDALRVAKEMPTRLQGQMNTLSYKLQPVALLGNAYSRQINYLETQLLKQASDALSFGETTLLELSHFCDTENKFPMLVPQIRNMINAADFATREFSSKLRELLPELRDALANTAVRMSELQSAIELYQFQMQAASKFLSKKRDEASSLNDIVEKLCTLGFVNEIHGTTAYRQPLGGPLTLLLSLGGESVINPLHPLQQHVESRQVCNPLDEDDWFESSENIDRVHDSYEKLKSLQNRLRELGAKAPDVVFAVANISKVQCGGSKSESKYVSTVPGDVVLSHKGKLVVVTGKLPGDVAQSPPIVSTVSHDCFVVDVPMNDCGGSEPEPINALTPTKIQVRWRRYGDSSWTGTTSLDWRRDAQELVVSPLLPKVKYEVQMCILTKLGPTCWSTSTTVVTAPRSFSRKTALSPTTTDMEAELMRVASDTSTLAAVEGNRSSFVVVHVNADSVSQDLSDDFSDFNSVSSSATVTPVSTSSDDALVQSAAVAVSSRNAAQTVPASSVSKLAVLGVSGVLASFVVIGLVIKAACSRPSEREVSASE
ncbi:hypothetical protein HK405_011876 [Cladochytrium tenue]|nr:hypothetical protein HK405_011876 [Cladochytrium tenue]